MLPYCQLHASVGAKHNFPKSPAPNSVEQHISRYARPTQNKSNHDQYQSGPHRNPLMLKTFLASSNMFKHAHLKLSKSTSQTHLVVFLVLLNELEWPTHRWTSLSKQVLETSLIFTTTSRVKKAVKKISKITHTSAQSFTRLNRQQGQASSSLPFFTYIPQNLWYHYWFCWCSGLIPEVSLDWFRMFR